MSSKADEREWLPPYSPNQKTKTRHSIHYTASQRSGDPVLLKKHLLNGWEERSDDHSRASLTNSWTGTDVDRRSSQNTFLAIELREASYTAILSRNYHPDRP